MDLYVQLARNTIETYIRSRKIYEPNPDELAEEMKSGRAGAEKSRRPWRKGEARKKNRGAQNHRQTGEGRIGVPAFCSRRAQRGGEPT